MIDYEKLYYKTFNAITDAERVMTEAIEMLKSVQQECEKTIVESEDMPIISILTVED